MTKQIKAKDIWDNIKHYETAFIEELINEIGSKVQYDDDKIEFTLKIKDLKINGKKVK